MGSIRELHVRTPIYSHFVALNVRHREDGQLDFDAMDAFMGHVLRALEEHGTRAVNVFPPEAGVLLAFAERLAHEVVCSLCYILLYKSLNTLR